MKPTVAGGTMRSDVFFDSNVVLYLASEDAGRASRSEALLKRGGVVSAQVLNEIANVLRGRKWEWSWTEVHEFLRPLRDGTFVVPVTDVTHERGLMYAEKYLLSVFDASIVAAAVLAGCTTLYSEDMHHGLVIDGLTIRNPYVG